MAKAKSKPEYVSVRLTTEVHAKLKEVGKKNETFSDVILRLIDEAGL